MVNEESVEVEVGFVETIQMKEMENKECLKEDRLETNSLKKEHEGCQKEVDWRARTVEE